jgi:5-methyltetrahydrofolate--homocysteine methyltransferase
MQPFIVIGENIHCSRTVKTTGPRVRDNAIVFDGGVLPVPDAIRSGTDWTNGIVHPCSVAAWQGLHGSDCDKIAATAFITALAQAQTEAGARFLDINVDAFSSDIAERCAAMKWIAGVAQRAVATPLCIDSSHPAVLEAGLAACTKGTALLNSVSLERRESIAVAAAHRAGVIASAAGEHDIPATAEGRLANFAQLAVLLKKAGIIGEKIYFDPLVLPVGVDPVQPGVTLATIRQARKMYGDTIHITGGFSNVSFGMPQRKMLNEVFVWMALEAGADSGIVDPLLTGPRRIAALDPQSEPFRLAHAVLAGTDEYGAEFLAASRDGRLGK